MAADTPAMLLAAGRGTRLGEHGRHRPKPLMAINGRPAITLVLARLRAAGIRRVVVNLHHLGDQIEAALGDGSDFGVRISYSRESELLDVAGGIVNARPLLGDQPFIAVSADLLHDFDYSRLAARAQSPGDSLGHLVLGANPSFRPAGDFFLADGMVQPLEGRDGLTYISSGVYCWEFFAGFQAGRPAPMMPLWRAAMAAGRLSGEAYGGPWIDIGTAERLAAAQNMFADG